MATPVTKRVEVARRRARALQLRQRGWTYQQIADELGLRTRQQAHSDVQRALDAALGEMTEDAQRLRAMALERLDELSREAWAVHDRPHFMTNGGQIVHVETADGRQVPLRDDRPKLQALEVLRRLEERRAKLQGTDAPTRLETEVSGDVHPPATYIISIGATEADDG